MNKKTITTLIFLLLIVLPAPIYSHYFPVAEVNHIVEVTVELHRISIKYLLWVPGGQDSVIIEKLSTSYAFLKIPEEAIEKYASWSVIHYENCLNVFLDGERIRFKCAAKPVNFESFGLVFQYEHRFKEVLRGKHRFLLLDNNDTEVKKSTEELLLLGGKKVKIGRQNKSKRRFEARITFKTPRNYTLPGNDELPPLLELDQQAVPVPLTGLPFGDGPPVPLTGLR